MSDHVVGLVIAVVITITIIITIKGTTIRNEKERTSSNTRSYITFTTPIPNKIIVTMIHDKPLPHENMRKPDKRRSRIITRTSTMIMIGNT